MRFAQPHFFHGLWLVGLLVVFFVVSYRNKKTALLKFAKQQTLSAISETHDAKRAIVKFIMLCVVFVLSIAALAQPQWGFKWQKIKRHGLDLLIAIDTSKSMLATDVLPNRLDRSKLAVKDLLKKLKGDRIGLIAFSGSAFLQCPLTVDYGGFLLSLEDLNLYTIVRGGTSLASAIEEAIKVFKETSDKYRVLVIITDGEDHEGRVVEAAQRARKANIKIYCIGIGTKDGELIQVIGENGKKAFLKDRDGTVVKSRLDETLLQKIAFTTGGTYVHSGGAEFGLEYIYEEKLSQLERREIKETMSKLYTDRYQLPLALALMCLMLEPFISNRKKV